MRGPALLAMRLQLLLAQAACAHGAAAKAGDEAAHEAGRGGRGGWGGSGSGRLHAVRRPG